MMEFLSSCETSVLTRGTRRNIPTFLKGNFVVDETEKSTVLAVCGDSYRIRATLESTVLAVCGDSYKIRATLESTVLAVSGDSYKIRATLETRCRIKCWRELVKSCHCLHDK
jgi:hypothetical protein